MWCVIACPLLAWILGLGGLGVLPGRMPLVSHFIVLAAVAAAAWHYAEGGDGVRPRTVALACWVVWLFFAIVDRPRSGFHPFGVYPRELFWLVGLPAALGFAGASRRTVSSALGWAALAAGATVAIWLGLLLVLISSAGGMD